MCTWVETGKSQKKWKEAEFGRKCYTLVSFEIFEFRGDDGMEILRKYNNPD